MFFFPSQKNSGLLALMGDVLENNKYSHVGGGRKAESTCRELLRAAPSPDGAFPSAVPAPLQRRPETLGGSFWSFPLIHSLFNCVLGQCTLYSSGICHLLIIWLMFNSLYKS